MGRTKCSKGRTCAKEKDRSANSAIARNAGPSHRLKPGSNVTTSSVDLVDAIVDQILELCVRILKELGAIRENILSAQPKRVREGWRRQLKRDLEGE